MRRHRLSRYMSGRHRGEAELYLYPDSTPALLRKRVERNTPRPLNPRVRDAVLIVHEVGRASRPVWMGPENLA